jgi:hypothetical protein
VWKHSIDVLSREPIFNFAFGNAMHDARCGPHDEQGTVITAWLLQRPVDLRNCRTPQHCDGFDQLVRNPKCFLAGVRRQAVINVNLEPLPMK